MVKDVCLHCLIGDIARVIDPIFQPNQTGLWTTEYMASARYLVISVDEAHKKWAFSASKEMSDAKCRPHIMEFSDLLDFYVIENGASVTGGSGGLLFGPVGALVGAAGTRGSADVCKQLDPPVSR